MNPQYGMIRLTVERYQEGEWVYPTSLRSHLWVTGGILGRVPFAEESSPDACQLLEEAFAITEARVAGAFPVLPILLDKYGHEFLLAEKERLMAVIAPRIRKPQWRSYILTLWGYEPSEPKWWLVGEVTARDTEYLASMLLELHRRWEVEGRHLPMPGECPHMSRALTVVRITCAEANCVPEEGRHFCSVVYITRCDTCHVCLEVSTVDGPLAPQPGYDADGNEVGG